LHGFVFRSTGQDYGRDQVLKGRRTCRTRMRHAIDDYAWGVALSSWRAANSTTG
jgi:hypothetical protein